MIPMNSEIYSLHKKLFFLRPLPRHDLKFTVRLFSYLHLKFRILKRLNAPKSSKQLLYRYSLWFDVELFFVFVRPKMLWIFIRNTFIIWLCRCIMYFCRCLNSWIIEFLVNFLHSISFFCGWTSPCWMEIKTVYRGF